MGGVGGESVWAVSVCMANIIRRLYSLSAFSLRRFRDFSRSLLRRLIPTAARPRVFCVMLWLCSGYALVMLWLCSGYALVIERSCAVGGRYPPLILA